MKSGQARFCGRSCAGRARGGDFAARFWSKVDKTGDCWLWTAYRNKGGYGAVQTAARYEAPVLAHRAAWELTHGAIPPGVFVCHSCDTPACVNPAHLFLGTDRDNKVDMMNKGRLPLGSRSVKAKLTEAQVIDIRQRYAAGGVRQIDLAAEYGVRDSTINRAIKRRGWKHVA
ncbi:MAG TPA: HNH endonuclease [Chloroflexota bacterium]|nr:HNH endonuclease [Chloroflexota bacterium]